MKKMKLIFVLCFLVLAACSKEDRPKNPVDTLPPITQTGEDTFACLINGKPFFSSTGKRRASYVPADGAFSLSLSAWRNDDIGLRSILLSCLDIKGGVKEGAFPLTTRMSGGYSAKYLIGGGRVLDARTSDESPGLLTITRFDLEEGIISGTFEFTVKDQEGNTLNFTDGRFDFRS